MQQIPRLPADSASDDFLIHRLYELAMAGGDGSSEWQRLDEVVYTRLIDAYGCEAPDLRPRLVA
ncbi:hypothetical protein [Cognatilysobacter tabacisoli]|uniref:hypothetical protein n=1 Tax=Cognatilysobacter tabacisoli TaxID=2315424 RepID=UPI000E6B3E80|nr:hypothetical protein [Lysobacter tabacisoli]